MHFGSTFVHFGMFLMHFGAILMHIGVYLMLFCGRNVVFACKNNISLTKASAQAKHICSQQGKSATGRVVFVVFFDGFRWFLVVCEDFAGFLVHFWWFPVCILMVFGDFSGISVVLRGFWWFTLVFWAFLWCFLWYITVFFDVAYWFLVVFTGF